MHDILPPDRRCAVTQQPSELTKASDALAVAVTALLPHDHDPQQIANFRTALGDLLAATLGGATAMAAGAVVAVNNKLDRLAEVRGQRLREVQLDLDRVSARVHALEDAFLDAGTVGQLAVTMYALAHEMERLAQEIEHLKAPADHAAE